MSNNILQSSFIKIYRLTLDHQHPRALSCHRRLGGIIQLWQLAGAYSPHSVGPAAGIFLLSSRSVNLLLATPWLNTRLSWRLKQKITDCSESKKSPFQSLAALGKYFRMYVCVQIKGCCPYDSRLISANSSTGEWNVRTTETLNSEAFQWNVFGAQ